ncbi:putative eukaryotic translation initiation factor 3 subunit E [Helianthus annuus]|nr:putative eukaryotic translation initiation factor 3 subunit E [Helianthus annuus]KAJ0719666.1 putative eukaryotic translation initiation factor 3 subunit E [Helianthus annuus]KAJ0722895.1 putative eukaryotic translation initiation factor 3 subunit E [Helianthus annuus]
MAMAKYDLTPRIAPNLDRHLMFPLLEFTQECQLYPNDQILKAKIELLNNTNMVDYAMDIHKSLYHTEDVPQGKITRLHICRWVAIIELVIHYVRLDCL